MQWHSSTLYGSSMSKYALYAAWTSADVWYFRCWILGDLPLAISRKLAGSSAWYLCSSRGESLMKLVRSGEYLGSRLSGRGKDLGKNQNGTAESRVMNPAIRYPSHQAPTQRASPGVMLMLSVRRQSHTHTSTERIQTLRGSLQLVTCSEYLGQADSRGRRRLWSTDSLRCLTLSLDALSSSCTLRQPPCCQEIETFVAFHINTQWINQTHFLPHLILKKQNEMFSGMLKLLFSVQKMVNYASR